jgi:hypothetical protein
VDQSVWGTPLWSLAAAKIGPLDTINRFNNFSLGDGLYHVVQIVMAFGITVVTSISTRGAS